jgi:hypothetical protein
VTPVCEMPYRIEELKVDELCAIEEEVGDLRQRFGYVLEKHLLREAAGE